MNKNGSAIVGLGLIIIGVLSILINFNILDIEFWEFWPFIILLIGLLFEIGFFMGGRNDTGLLVPAGILMTISIIFIVNTFSGWDTMTYLWPLFIMAPGVGILQMFLFSKVKDYALLIPVTISMLLGGYFLVGNFYVVDFAVFASAMIILFGLFLVFKKKPKHYEA